MFAVIVLCGLATSWGINAYCYRDEDDIMVELIGNQLRKNATAVETVDVVGNADRCMDHCLYKGYCVSFNAIQEDHKVKCELFNITSNDKTLLKKHVNSSYYEVHLTCQNSSNVANKSGCGSNCSMKRDCVDWLQAGFNKSDVYEININGKMTKVFCDMETEGGGGIRFYNRVENSRILNGKQRVNYEKGFGDADGDYWLGLENIHQLTATGENSLYLETLTSLFICSGFKIAGESSRYKLETKCSCISSLVAICYSCSAVQEDDNIVFSLNNNYAGWYFNYCYGGINLLHVYKMMLKPKKTVNT